MCDLIFVKNNYKINRKCRLADGSYGPALQNFTLELFFNENSYYGGESKPDFELIKKICTDP